MVTCGSILVCMGFWYIPSRHRMCKSEAEEDHFISFYFVPLLLSLCVYRLDFLHVGHTFVFLWCLILLYLHLFDNLWLKHVFLSGWGFADFCHMLAYIRLFLFCQHIVFSCSVSVLELLDLFFSFLPFSNVFFLVFNSCFSVVPTVNPT